MGAWATLRLALTGKELDFTSGPIGRAIILLAIPMVLEMVMESVFALSDAFFVSRLGTDALATVGLTEAMISLLFAVAIGTGMATTAMVARRIGERDTEAAGIAAAQSIVLGILLSLAIAVPGVIFARQLLTLMGGTPELVASGYGYTQVMFSGSATIMLIFLLNAVFRGAGDISGYEWIRLPGVHGRGPVVGAVTGEIESDSGGAGGGHEADAQAGGYKDQA